MKLERERKYKVIASGARLIWWKPLGYSSAWKFERYDLQPGETVVYIGKRAGWGSDNVDYDWFAVENTDITGGFEPEYWGMARPDGLLEPLD
jgi:hypothetical protein